MIALRHLIPTIAAAGALANATHATPDTTLSLHAMSGPQIGRDEPVRSDRGSRLVSTLRDGYDALLVLKAGEEPHGRNWLDSRREVRARLNEDLRALLAALGVSDRDSYFRDLPRSQDARSVVGNLSRISDYLSSGSRYSAREVDRALQDIEDLIVHGCRDRFVDPLHYTPQRSSSAAAETSLERNLRTLSIAAVLISYYVDRRVERLVSSERSAISSLISNASSSYRAVTAQLRDLSSDDRRWLDSLSRDIDSFRSMLSRGGDRFPLQEADRAASALIILLQETRRR